MGNNAAYTNWEASVIALYNAGELNPATLDILSEIYRGTDIDSGGSMDLHSNDGKDVEQICVETIHPGVTPDVDPDYPEEGPAWYLYFSEMKYFRWGWR